METEFSKLNEYYKPLYERAKRICGSLNAAGLKAVWAFYNGHYVRDGEKWVMEYFPVPVISVEGLCDIELHRGIISVSSKLKRADAISFDYNLLGGMKFEAYGVENYLENFYAEEIPLNKLKANIEKSAEEEIGFSFFFEEDEILRGVNSIKEKGFYY